MFNIFLEESLDLKQKLSKLLEHFSCIKYDLNKKAEVPLLKKCCFLAKNTQTCSIVLEYLLFFLKSNIVR